MKKHGERGNRKELRNNVKGDIPLSPKQRCQGPLLEEIAAVISIEKENAQKNLENARALFESYLQGIFVKGNDHWREEKLKDVCEIRPPKKEARDLLKADDWVSFVPMRDLGLAKDLIPVQERRFKEVVRDYSYFRDNDILLAIMAPCFGNGKIGIARNLKNGIGFGSEKCAILRVKDKLVPDYLYYFLNRNQFRRSAEKVMRGAVGRKLVPLYFIESQNIPYPLSLSEQYSIVANLDEFCGKIKKLETVYRQKITELEELKKSILF